MRVLVDCTWSEGERLQANPAAKTLMTRYGVTGYPSVVLLDPKGRLLDRFASCRKASFVRKMLRRTRDALAALTGLEAAPPDRRREALRAAEKVEGLPQDSVLAKRIAEAREALGESFTSVRFRPERTVRTESFSVEFASKVRKTVLFRILAGAARDARVEVVDQQPRGLPGARGFLCDAALGQRVVEVRDSHGSVAPPSLLAVAFWYIGWIGLFTHARTLPQRRRALGWVALSILWTLALQGLA